MIQMEKRKLKKKLFYSSLTKLKTVYRIMSHMLNKLECFNSVRSYKASHSFLPEIRCWFGEHDLKVIDEFKLAFKLGLSDSVSRTKSLKRLFEITFRLCQNVYNVAKANRSNHNDRKDVQQAVVVVFVDEAFWHAHKNI